MNIPTLLDVIRRVGAGDRDALSVLYEASYDRVYRFVYHRTLDTPLTEDIVAEVFIKVLRKIHTLRATSEGEFFSWILRIAYTTMIDTFRLQKDTNSLDDMLYEPESYHDLASDIDNKNTVEEVLTFMDTLSERDRTILTMRIWDEMSYDEIAEITGETVANAKQIVSRSLAKIAANVEYMILFFFFLSFLTGHPLPETFIR